MNVRASAVAAVLAATFGLLAAFAYPAAPATTAPVDGFALTPQGDDVAQLSPITVTYPRSPAERSPDRLLALEPATPGSYAWLNERTLLFQPEFPGLRRGSTYTVRVLARPEAGVPDAIARRFTVGGRLTVQQVIPGDGDREVPLQAQILVQFSRSVAPLTTLAARRSEPVVRFDPPLAGSGEWLNTSIYRFVPKDVRPFTSYRATIAKGLTSAVDGALADDFAWTFSTISPAVATLSPEDKTTFAGPQQPVVVTFNQPMERSAAGGIAVRDASGAAVPGRIAWSEGDTVATFTPSGRLGALQRYTVSIAKGLRGVRGGETAGERTASFTTVGLPAIESTYPRDGATDTDRYGINLGFANPMDPESFEGKIAVSGFTAAELDGRVFAYERGLNVGVALRPSTAYTVRLAAGAKDRYGQVMGGYAFSFTTGALPSTVSLAAPGYLGGTYSSSGEPLLYYQSTNLSAVTFTLYPLDETEARTVIHDQPGRPFKPSRPALRTWTEKIADTRDRVILGKTSLSGGGPLPKGAYYLTTSGQSGSTLAFAVVDTEVITKLSTDELLAWAIDHDTGRPRAGATLRASGPGVSPAEAVTDANGLATFAVPSPLANAPVDRSYYVTLDGGGHFAVGTTRWQQGTSPYQLGLATDYYVRPWVGHVYSDRPIYRPGETVEYKGVIRADDDARYALPPARPGLDLVITNDRGQEVRREAIALSEFGSFAGRFELPGDAPLGGYSLRVDDKSNQGSVFGVSAAGFLVAEFRKPEFQVELATAKPSYVNGERIDARATATFFFGGALGGATVDWSALSDPYFMRATGYETFSFSDFDYWRPARTSEPIRASGRTTTGADGVASFAVPAVLPGGSGALQYTLSASVTDQNGQGVAANATAVVHPAALYAGVRPATYVASVGSASRVDLVTVDDDGAVVPRRAVTLKVYERRWVTSKEQTPGGGRQYRSEPVDTLVDTLGATTNEKGEATVSVTPAKAGTLRLVAEAADARGRIARAAAYLWVWGDEGASWQFTNDDVIKLVADKDRYEVGETASVLVPAPFAGAIGLVTTERGKIIGREVRDFPTNSERLRIPIVDRSVPNVFVSVVLYRAPTKVDPVPRFKLGYVELPVSTATRALDVAIRPDRARAAPGETVRYDIRVTDREGRGVRSELSAAVVDKAVLSLQEEVGPDGLKAFWFQRGLAVSTAASISVSIDRSNDVISDSPQSKGGAAGGFRADSPRSEFRNTAYWTAQLVTKDDGTASIAVKMPDNLTTWRMQVRAISGTTMVGESTNELVVTQPLLLRPALPRFLRVGDDVELRALLRNGTTASLDATVTLRATGVTLRGDLTRRTTVAAGQSVVLSWPAKAEAEGTARLTFSANGGGLADAVTQELPVALDVTPETMATGGIVAAEPGVEAVYLPPFADVAHGSLTVSVRSTLAGSLADELPALAPEAFEGAERVASRVLATLGVRRAARSAGSAKAAAYDGRIASDVAGLIGRQRPDGGWAWCDEPSCTTDPTVTGWVLQALGEARRDGIALDGGVLARASQYVTTYVNRATDVVAPADPNETAFLLAALVAAGDASRGIVPARSLFERQRARLNNSGRAYLALALAATATRDDPAVRALLDDLAGATIASANGSHWEDPATGRSFMRGTATTALVTLALARIHPDRVLLPQAVRWLVVARGAERWQTSVDRGLAVLALASYAESTGELAGDYGYAVSLDASELLAGRVDRGGAPLAATKAVPLTTLRPGTASVLRFDRDLLRPGRLYYTVDLRYVTPAKGIEALNRGFGVSHRYTALADASRPITSAAVGETVRVTVTVVVPADRNYVVVQDRLPAGLEAVDARLRTVDAALTERLEADRLESAQRTGAGAYVAPWFRWYYSPWQRVDLRDDRAVLSAQRVSKGVYEYVYYARAAAPGDFFVAPASAEETYFPEVFGRSDSGRFTVRP